MPDMIIDLFILLILWCYYYIRTFWALVVNHSRVELYYFIWNWQRIGRVVGLQHIAAAFAWPKAALIERIGISHKRYSDASQTNVFLPALALGVFLHECP